MQIGTALFLLAVGAILKFAVTDSVDGVNLESVGVILMIVGAIGVALSLLFISRAREAAGTTVVHERHDHVPPPR